MRNIFDQFTVPENRLTHALMTALDCDRTLLRDFLQQIAPPMPAPRPTDIEITVQSLPGRQREVDGATADKRGIPDAWLTAADEWCLIVECKLLGEVDQDQLTRHRLAARRLNFATPRLLVIVAQGSRDLLAPADRLVEWSTVYQWLKTHVDRSQWARWTAEYLEVLEAKMIEEGRFHYGSLTIFAGIPFSKDVPFNYLEAKRLLRLATAKLRQRPDLVEQLGVAPDLLGRGKIKDDAEAVWDVLRLEQSRGSKQFNDCPHLTLGIRPEALEAMLTLPHESRKRLPPVDFEQFRRHVRVVLEAMLPLLDACPGAQPRLRAQQRHWDPRGKPAVIDAVIDFDLRALDGSGKVKAQPQWLAAAFDAFANKSANIELQIGACFPYSHCDAVRDPSVLDAVAKAWLSCCSFMNEMVQS